MEHVIVTGGAGFIGSHLVERLLSLGYRVTVVDNFSTGHLTKLEPLLDNPYLKTLNHDITQPLNLECDYVFNLASRAAPNDFAKYPQDILMTNSVGVKNMIELALHNDAQFLQASTSEVYGDPQIVPQSEEYRGNVSSTGIRSCYDEGKRFAEALLASYHRKFDLDIRIARIFNTFGPRMNIDDGRVVSNFIRQSVQSNNLVIYGDGSQIRSFCYISDLVEGLVSFMFSNSNSLKGEVINLGNPDPITIKELALEIIDMVGSDSTITFAPLPEDDPKRRSPDISKAMNLLNWEPIIDRRQGLNMTIEYFRNVMAE